MSRERPAVVVARVAGLATLAGLAIMVLLPTLLRMAAVGH